MTFVEFLRARLNEDEVVARAAKGRRSGAWTCRTHESDPWIVVDGDDFVVHDDGRPSDEEAEHIARHDPAHVLAEVAAKRQMVTDHRCTEIEDGLGGDDWHCDHCGQPWTRSAGCSTLRLLALPYAEHPDYRQDWAPQP